MCTCWPSHCSPIGGFLACRWKLLLPGSVDICDSAPQPQAELEPFLDIYLFPSQCYRSAQLYLWFSARGVNAWQPSIEWKRRLQMQFSWGPVRWKSDGLVCCSNLIHPSISQEALAKVCELNVCAFVCKVGVKCRLPRLVWVLNKWEAPSLGLEMLKRYEFFSLSLLILPELAARSLLSPHPDALHLLGANPAVWLLWDPSVFVMLWLGYNSCYFGFLGGLSSVSPTPFPLWLIPWLRGQAVFYDYIG